MLVHVFENNAHLGTAHWPTGVSGGYGISDPTQPGVESVAGATLYPTPAVNAGEVLVADTRYIVLAIRRDASVDFSEDALFTSDGVAARVTMRVDWGGGRPGCVRGHRNADMSDPRWKAIRAVVVAGAPVKAGEVFTAFESKMADAVTRGWVKPAPANGRRRDKS